MPRYPYRQIGVELNRDFRNDQNKNLVDIAGDIAEQKARVDAQLTGVEQPSEVVDARVDADGTTHTVLKDRLDSDQQKITAQLAGILKKGQYRYLMTTFTAVDTNDGSPLIICLSRDGIYWHDLNISYKTPNLRDPFGFLYDDYFYVTATNLITKESITYIRTKDFQNFEKISADYVGLADYATRWAPSVFEYSSDIYMTISLKQSDGTDNAMYISKLSDDGNGVLIPGDWTRVSGSGFPGAGYYDGHVIIAENGFYIYFKDNSGGIMIMYSADDLFSGYSSLGYLNTDEAREAPWIIRLSDGTLRLYSDTPTGTGDLEYQDSHDDGANWSEIKPVKIDSGAIGKHCHVYDLTSVSWEKTFSLNPSFYPIKDLNTLVAGGYQNKTFKSDAANLPTEMDSDHQFGNVDLIDAGSGKYYQYIRYLSGQMYYRIYDGSSWGAFTRSIAYSVQNALTDISYRPFSGYFHSMFNPSTKNLPTIDNNLRYGYADLFYLGDNHWIQHLYFLNGLRMTREYVSGWSAWQLFATMPADSNIDWTSLTLINNNNGSLKYKKISIMGNIDNSTEIGMIKGTLSNLASGGEQICELPNVTPNVSKNIIIPASNNLLATDHNICLAIGGTLGIAHYNQSGVTDQDTYDINCTFSLS